MTAPDVRTAGCNRPLTETTNTDALIVTDLDAGRKAFLTLQASAALAGCGLHELASGAYLLTRWGMAKECDLRAAAALLARMTGGQ